MFYLLIHISRDIIIPRFLLFFEKSIFASVLRGPAYFLSLLFLLYLGFNGHSVGFPLILQYYLNQILAAISFCIVIISIASGSKYIVRFLDLRFFVFLGHISFGFYLYHQPLLIRAAQLGGLRIMDFQIMPNNLCAVFIWSLIFAVFNYFCGNPT